MFGMDGTTLSHVRRQTVVFSLFLELPISIVSLSGGEAGLDVDRLSRKSSLSAFTNATYVYLTDSTRFRHQYNRIPYASQPQSEQEKAAQEQARIQQEKQAAKKSQQLAEQRAKQAEADRLAAIAQAKIDREAAEAKAKRDAELAAQPEREKIESEKRAEAAAVAKREADKEHRAKVNGEALKAFVTAGLPEAMAKLAVSAVAKDDTWPAHSDVSTDRLTGWAEASVDQLRRHLDSSANLIRAVFEELTFK